VYKVLRIYVEVIVLLTNRTHGQSEQSSICMKNSLELFTAQRVDIIASITTDDTQDVQDQEDQ
jgi:hypothetical protein